MNIVLDSSVIAKWFLDEDNKQEALKFRNLHKEETLTIVAPTLIILELSNIFVTRKLNQKDFEGNLDMILNFQINFTDYQFHSLKSTFALSQRFHLSFYDATYVALAQQLHCDFITADKKLADMTKVLKFVKLLSQT